MVHTSAHTSHTHHHTESRSTALEEAQPVLGHHTQHHRAHTDLRGHHTPQTQISHATQTQSPQHSSNQDVHEDLSGIGKIDEDKGDKTENKRVDKVDKISDDKVVKTEAKMIVIDIFCHQC